jgi:hypothetical protein
MKAQSPTSYELSPAELAEWNRRTDPDRPHADFPDDEAWSDPLWRLANIYSCLSPEGETVQYEPTPEQRVVIWCIHVLGWQRIIIPKARQLGMSLTLCLIGLDMQLFEEGFQGALVDKTQPDAAKKMEEKVRFAWKNLISEIRGTLEVTADNDSEFTVQNVVPHEGVIAPSSFQCGVTFRGGTVRWLHVSEWGTIQNDNKTRAKSVEIKTGAMVAVERAADGICVIETTWKGGLDGELGPYVIEALNTPEDQKGAKSWRILFFGWQTEPSYRQAHGYIDAASAAYFRQCEERGVWLDHEQKLWYAEKRRTASNAKTIKEEFPTFVEECWENVLEGSIYGKYFAEALTGGAVGPFRIPRDYPVHTFWDLGHPLNTVCLLAQITPMEIRMVDVLMEVDMTLEQRAAWLRELGWDYGNHYLPWDADSDKDGIGIKPVALYRKALGPTVQVVPQCKSVWDGIGIVRQNFTRMVWCADMNAKADDISTPAARMKMAVDFLKRFRAARETSTGIAVDKPVHDRYSHIGSALSQLGLVIGSARVAHANHVGPRNAPDRPAPRVTYAGSQY